ncbi:hypothetical protein Tco_0138568 [Tanacetum coccineum]
MTTLADKAILSGADNRPPMLEKDMYDSWKSIMELYMLNRQHGRMILESVESGPLIWPSIVENGVTRPKKYSELSATEALQADCDIKATNIILQGLPPEVYALVAVQNSNSSAQPYDLILSVIEQLKTQVVHVKPSTSASGSQPSGKTKKDKILQTQSSTLKNKVESHPRKVKSSLKNKDHVVAPKGTAHVQYSKLNANSELKCVKCNGCMLSDNHDLCVLDYINKITTTTEVPLRKPVVLDNETSKPAVTLVYSRKPRNSKTNVPVSKSTGLLQFCIANKRTMYIFEGSNISVIPSSSLNACKSSKLSSIKFRNDHVAKILGYGDYQIRNVMISRVYYVEGLGHNLFSIGKIFYSNLEVAFCQHTRFIRNLEGVDLLTGSRGNNLYTLSLGDMMTSSPSYGTDVCLI